MANTKSSSGFATLKTYCYKERGDFNFQNQVCKEPLDLKPLTLRNKLPEALGGYIGSPLFDKARIPIDTGYDESGAPNWMIFRHRNRYGLT